jgi:nucleotide-binding universal stress UspA family protein
VAVFNRILVPLDGSELAETALQSARLIARKQAAELILITVSTYGQLLAPSPAGYSMMIPAQTPNLLDSDAENYLDTIYHKVYEPGLEIKTKAVSGDIAGNIVDLAAAEGVDLIIMTTHGYSGFTRWMMGSVTERVLRSAQCPVLVIRCADLPKQAVIPLDGSELSELALAPGLTLARLLGAQSTLLRINQEKKLSNLELSLLDAAEAGLGRHIDQQLDQEEEDNAANYLKNIARRYSSPEVEIRTVVLGGSPAESILAYVEAGAVDLLIMATHGHSGLRRWVYGSVTEKCLNNSACAMLIVRPSSASLN